jgi:hypothetical protein
VRADEGELREELSRLEAEIVVMRQIDSLSERARADLRAKEARRDTLARLLSELRD